MSDLVTTAVTAFMGFFAVMNPIANTAVFVGLTGSLAAATQRKVAFQAILSAFLIIAVFSMIGKGLFHLFGITLPALRLAGGVLVALIGYHMLQGGSSQLHQANEQESDASHLAISPLAIPILAGPGTIATAMNFSAAGGMGHIITTLIAFAVLCVITLLCFLSGKRLMAILGPDLVSVISRLMGLILTVIGTQMFLQGVHDAYLLFDWAPLNAHSQL